MLLIKNVLRPVGLAGRRPSEADAECMQTDEREQSRERNRQEMTGYDSWSSGLQTRDASISSTSHSRKCGVERGEHTENQILFAVTSGQS
jgi:hypothetical protein